MKNMRWILPIFLCCCIIFVGCSNQKGSELEKFDVSKQIISVNRETGSGTRISFLNFIGVEEDQLFEEEADVVSGTDVMLSAVGSDEYAIGYGSYSQFDSNVKIIAIDGIVPAVKTIKNGEYPFTRNFHLVTRKEPSAVTEDFLNYISTCEKIIEGNGYVSMIEMETTTSDKQKGTIKISGSSSVFPLIEDIAKEYKQINPDVDIEINQTDSSNGIQNVTDGIVDIAMASRELSQDELESTRQVLIAKDGIAVIVNKNNPIEGISADTLRKIYMGQINHWSDLQ